MNDQPRPVSTVGASARKVAVVWVPTLAILGSIKLLSMASGISLRQLLQDPATVMRAPFYIGIISNLGGLLWVATATICFFSVRCLTGWSSKGWRRFLLVSGLFTTLLLIDDVFLLHDQIMPFYLGVKGDVLGVVYVVFGALYVLYFRTLIWLSDFSLLVLAFGLFAISGGLDVVLPLLPERYRPREVIFWEDGAKLLGIVSWFAYFAHLSNALVRGTLLTPYKNG